VHRAREGNDKKVSTFSGDDFNVGLLWQGCDGTRESGEANAPTITVFVQNDRVKVYEGRFKPSDKSGRMAKRPARVEFAMTGGQMRHYYQDGKTEEVTWKAGEVKWSEPATYQQENIGKTEFRIRVVQLK
jgi:hypothetical protein